MQKGVEGGAERLAPVGEAVFDLRGDLGIEFAGDETVGLELAQLLGEHLLGDAGDEALEVGVTLDLAAEQVEEDD